MSGQGDIVIKVRGRHRSKLGGVFQPFSLDVKGGEMKIVLPSMPKGEIVGNMALQVGIDVNICMR